MSDWVIQARPPRGSAGDLAICRDPDILAGFLGDAAHFPGGYAAGLVVATCEADVAATLRQAATVLPIGAQSSLTGGATPRGEVVLSTAALTRVVELGTDRVRVGAGLPLAALDGLLAAAGRFYPPAPTYTGAFVGGTVATNAAGPATFKHGCTREWVEALTVVLPGGDVLDLARGVTRAHADGYFDIQHRHRTTRVPVPTYRLPQVPKVSAGYYAANGMDLIDLFIGAEGTLGVVTEVTLRIVPVRPATCLAFVPFPNRPGALAFTKRLREEARDTWRTGDARGLDISAIEHMDRRCLELLREDRVDGRLGVTWPEDSAMALLVTLDLPPSTREADAFAELGRALDADAPDTPLVRLCRTLADAGVLEHVEIAVPGDRARTEQLRLLREAVPAAVNQRVGRAQHAIDVRIDKTAADMIVPFDRLDELLVRYDEAFGGRGLDAAVWGHISDGNLHPNVIPRSFADVALGKDAILQLGREVLAMGGSPLAEHGVGRNPVKQQLLQDMYGAHGIEEMQRVKRALDPEWRLAPGVLFPGRRPI